MKLLPSRCLLLAAAATTALIVAACGSEAKPTSAPPATATRAAPTPTQAAATTAAPTPTRAAPTATAVRPTTVATTATAVPATPTRAAPTGTPAPSPTASGAIPTPVVKQPTKRGGVLQLRTLSPIPAFDAYDQAGNVEFHYFGMMLNNLIWPDPYGKALIGDIAEGWTFSEGGKVVTFALRKGIKFHDGSTLTAKDVVYNLDRGWHPRDARMIQFKTRFSVFQKLEAVDDTTVRLTLAAPSNVAMLAIGGPGVLMYPASYPFPERKDEWKKTPIGSGPFKIKTVDANIKIEYVKYDGYFKTGMPYLDGLVLTVMTNEVAVASFRTGRLDSTNLDSTPILNQLNDLKRQFGFVPVRLAVSIPHVELNQKPPFTDPKVREALSLALDRQAFVDVWLNGEGSRLAPSLLPPEFGGQWGISSKDLENRPGYVLNKASDIARAKQLIKDSGIDPGKFTLSILTSSVYPVFGELVSAASRDLGFKTTIFAGAAGDLTERQLAGNFDINTNSPTFTFDDPNDRLASQVTTGGNFNYGKWSNLKLDQLLNEQDRVFDAAKRRAILLEAQEIVLTDRVYIPAAVRYGYHGYMPYVKNFPTNLPFLFSPAFRWEQVWSEK